MLYVNIQIFIEICKIKLIVCNLSFDYRFYSEFNYNVVEFMGDIMKIEISKNIGIQITQDDLRNAVIDIEGDFLLTSKNTEQIKVHKGLEIHFVKVNDILFVESFGDEVLLHLDNDEYRTELKLSDFQQFNSIFLRINKSMIVNKTKIQRIRPALNMKYQVFLKSRWLDVNRTYFYLFEEEMGI
jgi:DNA-binding LytR/AlgR family response regulator